MGGPLQATNGPAGLRIQQGQMGPPRPQPGYAGCSYKFEQNPRLKEILLATKGVLAEASPYDKVWGIDLDEKDPRARNPGQWQGTNWLGQVLMHVRKDLKDPLTLGVKRRLILHAAKHGLPCGDLFLQDCHG